MKLQKFENVDVIASLEAIMKQNTAFYQSDFDIDKQILRKAAVSLIPEDKRLLWFSRPSGTCCFRERDVFLKDTRQHNTWRFYGEQTRDTILAYAVELTGTEQEKIKGNLYELDYLQHFREVIEKSIPADNYTLIYEHGELTKPAGQYFDGDTDPQLGKFIRFEAQPNDPEALKSLLRKQQKKRTPHTQRDFQLHIAALHDRQIEIEARRIVENVKGLGEPDSPEKTHCAVELSPYFVPLATDKDMERLRFKINKLLRHLEFVYNISVSRADCMRPFFTEKLVNRGFDKLAVFVGKHLRCVPIAFVVNFPFVPNFNVPFLKPAHIV